MGTASIRGCLLGSTPQTRTILEKWPTRVPISMQGMIKIVHCAAVRTPSPNREAAAAAPAALEKNAENRTAAASPGRPNKRIIGAQTIARTSINPVRVRNCMMT